MDQIVIEIVHAAPFMAVTMFLTRMIWVRKLERNNREWSDFCTKLNKSCGELQEALGPAERGRKQSECNITKNG